MYVFTAMLDTVWALVDRHLQMVRTARTNKTETKYYPYTFPILCFHYVRHVNCMARLGAGLRMHGALSPFPYTRSWCVKYWWYLSPSGPHHFSRYHCSILAISLWNRSFCSLPVCRVLRWAFSDSGHLNFWQFCIISR